MLVLSSADAVYRIPPLLRSLGIIRSMRSYAILSECLQCILDQEDRLEAVQKEIYEPLAENHTCDWTAIQSAVRRAAQTAWTTNPDLVRELAGYPLTGCPLGSAVFGDAVQCAGPQLIILAGSSPPASPPAEYGYTPV